MSCPEKPEGDDPFARRRARAGNGNERMKRIICMAMSVMTAALAATGCGSAREKGSEELPKVYMIKDI